MTKPVDAQKFIELVQRVFEDRARNLELIRHRSG
jgi:hypothetical protein